MFKVYVWNFNRGFDGYWEYDCSCFTLDEAHQYAVYELEAWGDQVEIRDGSNCDAVVYESGKGLLAA